MPVSVLTAPRDLADLCLGLHLEGLPPPPLVREPHVGACLARLRTLAPDLFQVDEVGRSVEGRPLRLVRFGHGPRPVLLWSQMHGDEPTATTALLVLCEYVRQHRDAPRVAKLLSEFTLHALPLLNPDGAERFQRRNAQNLDINRDALVLQTPEGRTLKALRDRLEPVLGFNLHNQNWRTAVGETRQPASISLLAPPFDAARNDNPGRLLAKKVCAVIRDALEPLIPGRIGRYDDGFEPRAFGDNLGRWGTPTVLIESGPWPSAEPEQPLVQMNFVALVSALEALAGGHVERADLGRYTSIPLNWGQGYLHLLLRGGQVFGEAGEAFVADVGVEGLRAVRGEGSEARVVVTGRVEELGDLHVFGAQETLDVTGCWVVPLPPGDVGEGQVVPLPPREARTLRLEQPAELLVLRPLAGAPERGRVERVIRYAR
ncbi:M14 family metallopeptidase [Archangium primigenium]|uniref:M14 family metallopeptidase n=1 Tax=[Archangium] primigenium TaxID=2792470 RepID=UPI001959A4CE|nr:peptidase M14 [Archangium primigenium]